MKIMQGDEYGIPFHITLDGETVTQADEVEITIGQFTKTTASGVSYDAGSGSWVFPLTQEESFAMGAYEEASVRVKLSGHGVIGRNVGRIDIEKSKSKAVL